MADAGVIVDNATRLSKRGAVTWWHLDDCGEFVYQVRRNADQRPRARVPTEHWFTSYKTAARCQVALPLGGAPHLVGPNGLPVTKIFVFAPVDAYDLITQVWGCAAWEEGAAAWDRIEYVCKLKFEPTLRFR